MNEPTQSDTLTIQHVSKILLSCINDEAAPIEDLAQRVVDWANTKERELNQSKQDAAEYISRTDPLIGCVHWLHGGENEPKCGECRACVLEQLNQWKECAARLSVSFPYPELTAGNADAVVYHLEKTGSSGIEPKALAKWVRSISSALRIYGSALSHYNQLKQGEGK